MRYAIVLGAAALVAASPAPQAFDLPNFDAAVLTDGPPVGVGPAQQTAYVQGSAQSVAAAAATGPATAAAAKRSLNERSLEARTFWWLWPQKNSNPAPKPQPQPQPSSNPGPTTTPPAVITATPTSIVVPSTCTPVAWTNTNAFTSIPACPTAIEVGTYCGFINPEDPCAPQPAGAGTPPKDDTVDGFLNNPDYKQLAVSAKTPTGYSQSFVNLQGATTGGGYISYKTLNSYDVAGCSQFCDSVETCTGFNIYIERDPAWNPSQCSCDQPPSTINYKCSIWGQKVTKDTATNTGGGRDNFKVVITGSNGYNKGSDNSGGNNPPPPPSPPNCKKPQNCKNKVHDHPRYCIGQKTFPGPYDASVCAAYAQKQNQVNRASGWFGMFMSWFGGNQAGCVQFQASYLEKNGIGYGTHCRLFSKSFLSSEATLDISSSFGQGWSCGTSYTFDVAVEANFDWGFQWKH